MLLWHAPVDAGVVYLRDNSASFNGNAVTTTTFDDTMVQGIFGGTGGTTNNGAASNLTIRTTVNNLDVALIGVKDLFALLPKTIGTDQIVITSATLHVYANASFAGDPNSTVSAYRMTSDWLGAAAGSNEGNVSGRYRIVSSTTNWQVGNSFSPADYTTAESGSITWTGTTNALNSIPVTSIVAKMYELDQNYGFALVTTSVSSLSMRSSEQTTTITPVLEISYEYQAIPEPASIALVSLGIGMLLCRSRKCDLGVLN
jgi:hypothetical protein